MFTHISLHYLKKKISLPDRPMMVITQKITSVAFEIHDGECVRVQLKFRIHTGMMHWDAVSGGCCCDCQMCCQRARETN